jgi:hypothetical protein
MERYIVVERDRRVGSTEGNNEEVTRYQTTEYIAHRGTIYTILKYSKGHGEEQILELDKEMGSIALLSSWRPELRRGGVSRGSNAFDAFDESSTRVRRGGR